MEGFVKLSIICLLVVFSSVNEGSAYETPTYIKELLASANKISSIPFKTPTQNSSYDFIIVGAGAAGCVLANRLSANPNITVYLLEAGGPETAEVNEMPALTIGLQATPFNYGYTTVPQNYSCFGMNNHSCGVPQGKGLGGSSLLEYLIYNRGDRESFDNWAAAGNDGWSYDDVLPYFLRSENSSLVNYHDSPYHNYSGSYISTEDVKYRTPIASAFIQACKEDGLEYIDYNNPNTKQGCSYTQATSLNGRRHSAFKAYIEPIQAERSNLRVLPYSLVTKILIDPKTKTAYGVDFEHLGQNFTIRANKEVILSAGPFHSPQLLIVSGVGPAATLENIGVPQIVDLPVGETLYDHPSNIGPIFTVNTTLATLFVDRVTPIDIAKFKGGDPSTRVSSISAIEASAYIKDYIELIMVSATIAVDFGTIFRSSINMRNDVYDKYFKDLEGVEHFGFLTELCQPASVGSLWVESSDVKVPPKINPNYYSRSEDVEKVLEGIKKGIEIISLPGMQAINATLVKTKVPGCEHFEFESDDYWRCSIRTFTLPLHHHMGTCKMGPISDKTSVVDSHLRVHDIIGLRVVDTSVVPLPICGHTQATAYMIGEKAADDIIADLTK